MPSAAVEATEQKFAKIIAAIDAKLGEREPGMTDAQLWKQDLKGYYTDLLYKYDRLQAAGVIVPDVDVVDVT